MGGWVPRTSYWPGALRVGPTAARANDWYGMISPGLITPSSIARVSSASLLGAGRPVAAYFAHFDDAHAPLVRVEVHLGSGIPTFALVGLPEAVVRESKERVRAAIEREALAARFRRVQLTAMSRDAASSVLYRPT